MQKITGQLVILCLTLGFILLAHDGPAAPLPKSTQNILKKLKLDPSILSGVDEELQVPKGWIEKTRQEGKLKVRSSSITPKELKLFLAPFKERYPFIDIEYFGANRQSRTIKTLVAYRSGRFLADLVVNVGTFVDEFKKAKGLEDLLSIPGLRNLPEGLKDPKGEWAGTFTIYWCMTYNTKLVNKRDLPKRWEDLLINPRWRGGNLALGNRPNLFAANLWLAKGERWTKDFLTRLFNEVKPQLRKEGMSALAQLAAAGEFHAVIPSHYKSPYVLVQDGAPVGFFCPEPVPAAVGGAAIILKGAPNINAAKIYLNWLLSKEGQIAQYASTNWTPAHRDLVRKEFLPFADQILGKEQSFTSPNVASEIMPQLFEFWNGLWLKRGGKLR